MTLPSIQPPTRVLVQTDPVQLRKFSLSFNLSPSFDDADTKLIARLCEQLSINTTKIRHLITQIDNEKKSERVNIVFYYGAVAASPQVKAYKIRGSGVDLQEFFNPHIRGVVSRHVEAHREINLDHDREFLVRPDIRAATWEKRLAMRRASGS